MEACSVLSDCRKAGVPDESQRNSVGSDQRAPTTKYESDISGRLGGDMRHHSKTPSLASRGSPRAQTTTPELLCPLGGAGSQHQRAPTTKNESDNSGTEGGEQLALHSRPHAAA